MKKRIQIIIAIIFTTFVSGFYFSSQPKKESNQDSKRMNQEIITIHPGIEGKLDAKNQHFDIKNHPSGVFSYTKHWDDAGSLGLVRVSHGKHSFEIRNATIVTGLGDNSNPEMGVDNWDILFHITPNKFTSYTDAREKTMEFLSLLRANGWQRYIDTSDPRLSGEQVMRYEFSEGRQIYSLDSKYTPTIEEWKDLVQMEPQWEFYTDGVFVSLTLSYFPSDKPQTGQYLMDLKISTAADNYSAYFSSDDDEKRVHWLKYISAKLELARAERRANETKLAAQGYTIDTTYQDPPFEAPGFASDISPRASH